MVSGDITVKDLYVYFPVREGLVKAVDGINISFRHGSFTAIIGESGCGKSVLGQALLNILPDYADRSGGILYRDTDIFGKIGLPENFYGKIFAVVPQNPGDSLNPVRRIGRQMDDVLQACGISDRDNVRKLQCLRTFGMQEPERVLQMYPFELSGGMQQRVLCAMSISCSPEWILADEPTKGLDEQVCGVVYSNLLQIKKSASAGMIIITHDIKLARGVCDYVAVMYAGQILEAGDNIFGKPLHPYTQAFLDSLPENGFIPMQGRAPSPGEPLQGCKFAARCRYCSRKCLQEVPPVYVRGNTSVRCYLYA